MPLRACLLCGTPTAATRCPAHTLEPRARGNTFEPIRQAVANRDHWTCQECGVSLTPRTLHIAHLTPRAHGGTDHMTNLYASCSPCNLKRGTR